MRFYLMFCGNCNATYNMERVSRRLHDILCQSGHVVVADRCAAEIEIRLNGCPTSCLDETNPCQGSDRVISVSATNIDLCAPNEEALIHWVLGKIRELEGPACK